MSRYSKNGKPFYVDVGTSMVAVRCASNHDVIVEYDHARCPQIIKIAEDMCDRMNREVEIYNSGNYAKLREALVKVKEWMEHRIASCGFDASVTFLTMLEDVVLPILSATEKGKGGCDMSAKIKSGMYQIDTNDNIVADCEEPIGRIGLCFYADIKALGIGSFEIFPEYRRRGHGEAVLRKLIGKFKDICDLIYCFVDANNMPALALYRQIGQVSNIINNRGQYMATLWHRAKENQMEANNMAAMRDALSDACYAMFNFLKTQSGGYEEMANALDKAKAALATPPCNGEVGTVDERFERWQEFCGRYDKDCTGCPCKSPNTFAYCFAKWECMPYEEGENK